MEPVTWGFVGTIVGTIVGASASIIATFIAASNSRKLQQEASSLERKERARDFQRNNLLELQEALLNSIRLTGRAHLEDVESFRKVENKGKRPILSPELNQDILVSNKKLIMLTERIADQSLRESIKSLRSGMTNVIMAKTEDESYTVLQIAASLFEKTMENLGAVLRSSY